MYPEFRQWLASAPKISLPHHFDWSDIFVMSQKDKADMVYVPAGTFFMGNEDFLASKPLHKVYLSSYLIDRFPVTNRQFQKFMEEGGYEREDFWPKQGWIVRQQESWNQPRYWEIPPWNDPSHPVVGISWYEASAYACWANKELVTEAQWEKAGRGGMWLDGDILAKIANPLPQRRYPWGNDFPNANGIFRATYKEEPNYGNHSSSPVDIFPNGASVYGCMDMAGNVWEWCWDWYQRNYYQVSPTQNPCGPETGEYKILRGGSWCREAKQLDVSFRTKDEPQSGGWDLSGFRCVKNLP